YMVAVSTCRYPTSSAARTASYPRRPESCHVPSPTIGMATSPASLTVGISRAWVMAPIVVHRAWRCSGGGAGRVSVDVGRSAPGVDAQGRCPGPSLARGRRLPGAVACPGIDVDHYSHQNPRFSFG